MEQLKKSCACTGANLGKFIQPIILNILKTHPRNGYQITKEAEGYPTLENSRPDPTGIYRYLRVMEDKNLIKGDEQGVFQITELGKECLENWKQTLFVYQKKIENLIQLL